MKLQNGARLEQQARPVGIDPLSILHTELKLPISRR